jgi:hypothetical protein
MDRDEILRVLRAFEASGLEYVLIGATAMGFHGLVRATEDLDLFIRATAENVERLRAALRATYARTIRISKRSPRPTCSASTPRCATTHPAATCTSIF